MKPDDVALLENLLGSIIANLTSVLQDAELALRVLEARRGAPRGERPPKPQFAALVDDSRFVIRWNGCECQLGPTLPFRLFRRLALSTNHYVTVERLLDEVWGEPRPRASVRSAVRCLRRHLEAAGMEDLAQVIDGRQGHYALLLRDIDDSGASHGLRTGRARASHRPPP